MDRYYAQPVAVHQRAIVLAGKRFKNELVRHKHRDLSADEILHRLDANSRALRAANLHMRQLLDLDK